MNHFVQLHFCKIKILESMLKNIQNKKKGFLNTLRIIIF